MIDSEFIIKGEKVKSLKPKYNLIQVINASTGFVNKLNGYALQRYYANYELIAVINFDKEEITVVVLKEKENV